MDKYYVYEWYNVDSGIVFHVGKGTGNRFCSNKNRNKFFLSYKKSNNTDVRIVKDLMFEDDAWELESKLISYYWSIGQCFTNFHPGGKFICWNKGKIMNQEYKEQRRQLPSQHKNSKKIIQIDKNTNEIVGQYDSLGQAEKETNITKSNISCVCNGKRKTAGQYIFKFID